jgi:hypothetical protein
MHYRTAVCFNECKRVPCCNKRNQTVQVYEGGVMQGARLKPVDELEALFRGAGVDVQAPLVCSCGSGLTACVLALALHQVRASSSAYPAMFEETLAAVFASQQLYGTAGEVYQHRERLL